MTLSTDAPTHRDAVAPAPTWTETWETIAPCLPCDMRLVETLLDRIEWSRRP